MPGRYVKSLACLKAQVAELLGASKEILTPAFSNNEFDKVGRSVEFLAVLSAAGRRCSLWQFPDDQGHFIAQGWIAKIPFTRRKNHGADQVALDSGIASNFLK